MATVYVSVLIVSLWRYPLTAKALLTLGLITASSVARQIELPFRKRLATSVQSFRLAQLDWS